MSKTYRRTTKGPKRDWLPNISRYDIDDKLIPKYNISHYDQLKLEWVTKNPHRISDVDNWFHWMTEPSRWHHEFSTVPRRQRERRLLKKILKNEIDADDTVWPLNDVPHIYYW